MTFRRQKRLGLLTALALCLALPVWGYLASVGSAVHATGTLTPVTPIPVVTSSVSARAVTLHVADGDWVDAGATLIELDRSALDEDLASLRAALRANSARLLRLRAERDESWVIAVGSLTATEIDADRIRSESSILAARHRSLDLLAEQSEQRLQQLADAARGLTAQAEAVLRQIELLKEDRDAAASLQERGLGRADRLRSIEQSLAALEGRHQELSANLSQARAKADEIRIARDQEINARRLETLTGLAEAEATHRQLHGQIAILEATIAERRLTAPSAGHVSFLQPISEGTLVRAGTALISVQPRSEPLDAVVSLPAGALARLSANGPVQIHLGPTTDLPDLVLTGQIDRVIPSTKTDGTPNGGYFDVQLSVQGLERDHFPVARAGLPIIAVFPIDERSPIAMLIQPITRYFPRASEQAIAGGAEGG